MPAVSRYRLQPLKQQEGSGGIEPIRKTGRLKKLQIEGRKVVQGLVRGKRRYAKSKGDIHTYTGGYADEEALEAQMSKVLEHKKLLDFTKWKLFSQLFARHLAKQVQERREPSKTITIYDKATVSASKRKPAERVLQDAIAFIPGKAAIITRRRASYIVNRLSTMDPKQFHWNSIGRIVYTNRVIPNTNISELVADAAQTVGEYDRIPGQDIPGWEEFKDVLHAAGIPREKIGNKRRYYTVAEYQSKKLHKPRTEVDSALLSQSMSSSKPSPIAGRTRQKLVQQQQQQQQQGKKGKKNKKTKHVAPVFHEETDDDGAYHSPQEGETSGVHHHASMLRSHSSSSGSGRGGGRRARRGGHGGAAPHPLFKKRYKTPDSWISI
jgi:hypothetical protein